MKFPTRLIVIVVLCAAQAASQSIVHESDTQSWNDFQLTIPMTKRIDFVQQLTLRFGDNFTTGVDERWGAGWVFKVNKYFFFNKFYFHREALPPPRPNDYED